MRPTQKPLSPFSDNGTNIHTSENWVWVPLRDKWVDCTHKPEERVRQEWIRRLVTEGNFDLTQIDQERHLVHGTGSPRADIVVWGSAEAKASGQSALLIVETKAASGPIILQDFRQGESYARAGGCSFLVAATADNWAAYELTPGFPGAAKQINSWPTAIDFGDSKRLEKLKSSLREFDRDEFQRLLFDCHTLLRDHHAMTPDRAFDTISKVLFIKLNIERNQQFGTFTTEFLDNRKKYYVGNEISAHEVLFNETRDAFEADGLFEKHDKLDISEATFREIVSKLERFNLSKTSDDIKGIAFERFLGRTFRGELGQFFTPRPVVDFIVEAIDPREGELICDPAAGSGGFLIKAFEHVRSAVAADVQLQKDAAFDRIAKEYGSDATEEELTERDRRIDSEFEELNRELLPSQFVTGEGNQPIDTRVGRLAWKCIYGTDKEPRAARTAKMNMIMHGDGHGGIHWHDGLVDINGIFQERFDVVVTNPPFGATVSSTQLIGATPQSDVPDDSRYMKRQMERYGSQWKFSHNEVVRNRNTPILHQFEIGAGKRGRQTETLFLERCLKLLSPGGRLAIVLPNGNLNSASLAWLRRWAEGKAYLRGVVSLPSDTFTFSQASVAASVVFLDKFTATDSEKWDDAWKRSVRQTQDTFDAKRDKALADFGPRIITAEGDAELVAAATSLAAEGNTRALSWSLSPDDNLIRNAGKTSVKVGTWAGPSPVTPQVRTLRKVYAARAEQVKDKIAEAVSLLRAEMKKIDDDQKQACWELAKGFFDYPVFMAAPDSVGITSTGDTGPHVPNDLPEILHEWKKFRSSLSEGTSSEQVATGVPGNQTAETDQNLAEV